MYRNIYLAAGLAAAAALASCAKEPADLWAGPRQNLASVRSALQVYYGDQEGAFPEKLDALTKDGKYLQEIPKLKLPWHPESAAILYVEAKAVDAKLITDAGGYIYFYSKKYPAMQGTLIINCAHEFKKGEPLYLY